MDMSKHTKDAPQSLLQCPKCNGEFPAQGRERYVTIIETIRANQMLVGLLLQNITLGHKASAKFTVSDMHKSDRDALLQSGGILTDEQIELLKE